MMDEQVYSKNVRAEKVVGLRDVKGATVIINSPAEMGYRCPICLNKPDDGVNFDERLEWSEYNGFLYCHICNKDFPSALCMPDMDAAIGIYLDCIEEAIKRNKVDCSCVCHNPASSRAWCACCNGDNAVGRFRKSEA